MPNCFNLTRKSDLAAGPVILNTIDAEMCEHFGVPVHEEKWCGDWYNCIGWRLSCGKDWAGIRLDFTERISELIVEGDKHDLIGYYLIMSDVVDWLEENFTSDHWVEFGRKSGG